MARRFTRKKVMVMLSAAGVFAGLLMFNKVLLSRCYTTCLPRGPAYDALRLREVTIKVTHPLISSIDLVHLPSNTPTEDRLALGGLDGSGTGLFAVIDGHSSPHCSEHLKHVLLPALAKQMKKDGIAASHDKLVTSDPYNTNYPQHLVLDSLKSTDKKASSIKMDNNALEVTLKNAFVALDNNISSTALKCARGVAKGHSIRDGDCTQNMMRALSGACALVAVVTREDVHVGSTGDCRGVMGRKEGGAWLATLLTVDQNVQNKAEVDRLNEAHPGEENTVIMGGRLLGGLMPLRSFGDVSYKWNKEDLVITEQIPPFYETPPYLTAEPVVTSTSINKGDRFMILATDGLWDMLTNEVAVDMVGRVRDGDGQGRSSMMSSLFGSKKVDDCSKCGPENAATMLLWMALGGDEASVSNMLDLPKQVSRLYRDDISIMVVHFKQS